MIHVSHQKTYFKHRLVYVCLLVACVMITTGTSVLTTSDQAHADNWPAWMGPTHDGVYREHGIVESIPAKGLPVKWRHNIGGGYAGPAVADGNVVVFDYLKEDGKPFNDPSKRATLTGQERVTCLNESTGEVRWSKQYDCPYSISYPAGPRCTPTIDGDRVYTLGSEGDLHCYRMTDGELLWSKNFKRDFQAKILIWGSSAHPLIDGDLLYAMVGGQGQGVVAFNKMTGDVVWKALDVESGYCPPSIVEFAGKRQLIIYHPQGVVSLAPSDGTEYWREKLVPKYQMSIARPMVDGDLMYASGIGNVSMMLKLNSEEPGAEVLWRGNPKNSLYSANATPMFVDGVIYGSDCSVGSLIAVDAKTGDRLWQTFEATKPGEKRRVNHGTAFLTRVGDSDRYLILGETGQLMLARLTREKFESLGAFQALEPTGEAFGRSVLWSHPAYANRTAYLRNDTEIIAVDLAK